MAAGATYTPISTYTVTGSTSFTAINLTSIPSTYTDLVLVIDSGVTNAGYSDSDIRMRPNGGGSDIFSETKLYSNGSVGSSNRTSYSYNLNQGNTGSGRALNTFYFMNYSNTDKYKTVISRTNNSYGGQVRFSAGLIRDTAAISSIFMDLNFQSSNDWSIGSTFTLYGISAA